MKKKTTPKTVRAVDEDMRPEYDFSGGVRGKYAKTLRGLIELVPAKQRKMIAGKRQSKSTVDERKTVNGL